MEVEVKTFNALRCPNILPCHTNEEHYSNQEEDSETHLGSISRSFNITQKKQFTKIFLLGKKCFKQENVLALTDRQYHFH